MRCRRTLLKDSFADGDATKTGLRKQIIKLDIVELVEQWQGAHQTSINSSQYYCPTVLSVLPYTIAGCEGTVNSDVQDSPQALCPAWATYQTEAKICRWGTNRAAAAFGVTHENAHWCPVLAVQYPD
jgi:hypothetical protein